MKNSFCFLFLMIFVCGPVHAESLRDDILGTISSEKEYRVTRILTADTIELDDRKIVQLIGIRAPKAPKPPAPQKEFIFRGDFGTYIEEPVSPLSSVEERAIEFANTFLKNKTVRLEFDVEYRSGKPYPQTYVFLADGTLANAEILRNGYAELNIIPPNTKYADRLREAYLEAKKELRGLYGQ